MAGRDPSPGASFNEPPTFLSGAYWAMRAGIAPRLGRHAPDLFARLRARRFVRIQLAVAVAVAAVGVALLFTLTAVGLALIVIACWSAAIDILLLTRLTRSIDEAWVDLGLPPE